MPVEVRGHMKPVLILNGQLAAVAHQVASVHVGLWMGRGGREGERVSTASCLGTYHEQAIPLHARKPQEY